MAPRKTPGLNAAAWFSTFSATSASRPASTPTPAVGSFDFVVKAAGLGRYATTEDVERTIEEAQRARFHALITNPATGPILDKMLADNERLDDELQAERDAEDERERWDADNNGSACSARCGFCGRCS